MTYFDPKIYNYEALKAEGREVIDHMRWVKKLVLDNAKTDIEYELSRNDEYKPDTLEKIALEVKRDFIEELLEKYESTETGMIVSTIDYYEDE